MKLHPVSKPTSDSGTNAAVTLNIAAATNEPRWFTFYASYSDFPTGGLLTITVDSDTLVVPITSPGPGIEYTVFVPAGVTASGLLAAGGAGIVGRLAHMEMRT